MTKALSICVLVMGALLFFGWQKIELMKADYSALLLEKKTLADELAESEESKKRLSNVILQLDKAFAEREAKRLSSKQRLAELPDIQRGLRKEDAEFNDWSDAHVPVDLVRLLRNTRKGDSEN